MSAQDPDQFQAITSDRERERVLSELSLSGVQVTLQSDDHKSFSFRTIELRSSKYLVLKPISTMPKRLVSSEPVEILFGLSDGQYLIRALVQTSEVASTVISLSNDIHRLQRRNNFRIAVPSDGSAVFVATSIGGVSFPTPVEFSITDLSAGGMRLLWQAKVGMQPLLGTMLSGTLKTGSGLEIQTKAVVRNLFSTSSKSQIPVGLEFQGLSGQQQQDLLFACLQIFRTAIASRRI